MGETARVSVDPWEGIGKKWAKRGELTLENDVFKGLFLYLPFLWVFCRSYQMYICEKGDYYYIETK